MARKLKLAFALVPALVGTQVYALGLGGMRLQSALDQPFAAEIDLADVKPDELDTVKAQVASQADFARSGTERYHHLTKLRFSPQISPRGKPVIRVSSREPIREPYMDFLVEVVWPQGRLVKQYTLLLDPPVTAARSAPPIAPVAIEARTPRGLPSGSPPGRTEAAPRVPVAAPTPSPMGTLAPPSGPAAPPPASTPAEALPPAPRPASAAAPGVRQLSPIRPGTNLWRLARANTPPGATVSQTATALYRTNPDAFINGDVNRMRVGRTLVMPPDAEVFALSPEAAKQEFDAAMRGKPARRAPLTEPGTVAAETGDAQLRLAGAPDSGRSAGRAEGLEKDVLIARETSESARQEASEMRSRIRDLEAQLAEIQQLLRLRNEQLERVQGGGQTPPPATPEGVQTAAARPVPPSVSGEAGEPDAHLRNPLEALPPGAAEPGSPAGAPLTARPPVPSPVQPASSITGPDGPVSRPPAGEPGSRPAAVRSEGEASPALPPPPVVSKAPPRPTAAGPAPETARPPAPKVPAPAAEATAGDSTWRALLLPLAGVAGVTALGIGALTWLRSRRRLGRDSGVEFDSADLTEDSLSIGSGETGASETPAEAVGRRSVTPESGEIPAADRPSSAFASFGRSDVETDEADAISEADIYIAYGRYREAEELLRDEIKRNPSWMDLKFKLAEALFGARNTAGLAELTEAVRAAGGDQTHPDQWRRLVEMATDTAPGLVAGTVPPPPAVPPMAPVQPVPPVAPAAPVPRPRGLPSPAGETLGTSLEQNSSEFYVLDVSDAQKPSADLALAPGAPPARVEPARRGAAADRVSASQVEGPISTPISIELPPVDTVPSVDLKLGQVGGRAGAAAQAPRDQTATGMGGGLSELDLSLGDLHGGGDLDLYSLVDSTQTTPQSAEARGGPVDLSVLAPASDYPRVEPPAAAAGANSGLHGLLGQQEDSASSDLLSSQWQMDSGLWDETATKLDLARAYLEMGDKESARGILEEVGNEGNEDQRAEALELLRRTV